MCWSVSDDRWLTTWSPHANSSVNVRTAISRERMAVIAGRLTDINLTSPSQPPRLLTVRHRPTKLTAMPNTLLCAVNCQQRCSCYSQITSYQRAHLHTSVKATSHSLYLHAMSLSLLSLSSRHVWRHTTCSASDWLSDLQWAWLMPGRRVMDNVNQTAARRRRST